MAHNLELREGRASLVYVGEVPWHGLGTKFPEPLTLNQAIEAARGDYFVDKFPIYWLPELKVPNVAQKIDRVPKHYVTVRTDLMQTLGVVKNGYQVLQNKDAFCIVDDLVGEGAAIIDTLGILGSGERMWILCRLPNNISLKLPNNEVDTLKPYLLIVNSHDGSAGVRIALTTVRVVCNNTLQQAINNNIGQLIIRHTRNVKDRVKNAHKLMGLTNNTLAEVECLMQSMLDFSFPEGSLNSFTEALFPAAPTDLKLLNQGKRPMSIAHRDNVKALAQQDLRIKGTLWGAVNAVTSYVDHSLSPIVNSEKRLMHNWYGTGAQLKKEAWGIAESLVMDYSD